MLVVGGEAKTEEQGRKMLQQVIEDGSALDKLAEFVKAQGGDERMVYHPEQLPKASLRDAVLASEDGYVEKILCDEVGICSLILGGGRETKESEIDLSVGIILEKKVGASVKKGDILAYLYANDQQKLNIAKERLLKAYKFSQEERKEGPIVIGIVKQV